MHLHTNKIHFMSLVPLCNEKNLKILLKALFNLVPLCNCTCTPTKNNFYQFGPNNKCLVGLQLHSGTCAPIVKLCRNGFPTWAVGQDRNFRPREDKKILPLGLRPSGRIFFVLPWAEIPVLPSSPCRNETFYITV